MSALDATWEAVAQVLDNGWPGSFDDDRSAAYRFLLQPYLEHFADGVPVVLVAIRNLTPRSKFMPSAGEIAGECTRLLGVADDSAFDAPAPAVVVVEAEIAAWKCAGRKTARDRMQQLLGDVAADWFEQTDGWSVIRGTNLGPDDEHGALNRQRLMDSYREFVRVARDRKLRGLPATGGSVKRLGATVAARELLEGGAS